MMTEKVYDQESTAHFERRVLINSGTAVSLIAYDPSRDLYVFDVYA